MKLAFSVHVNSYTFQKNKTFEIDELKQILMFENIKSYKDFFIRILVFFFKKFLE